MADLERSHSPLFTFLISSMDEELYYHRIFVRPRQEIVFPRVDPKVPYGALAIFVQEAFDFLLSTLFDIEEWFVPFNMVHLRMEFPDKIYFNSMIGRAVCHFCAVHESYMFATEGGFDPSVWLKKTPFQAMEYAAKFLEIIRERTRPKNISIIYMLAFASQLVYEAIKSNKRELIDAACRSTVYMFHRAFPYEWIYWNTRLWSLTYNAVHNDFHQTWIPGGRFDDNLA